MYVCVHTSIICIKYACFPNKNARYWIRQDLWQVPLLPRQVMHGTYTPIDNSEIDHTQSSFTNTQRYDFFLRKRICTNYYTGEERHESHLPNSTTTSREQVNTHTTATTTNHHRHHVRNHIILDALSHPTRPFHKELTQMGVGGQSLIERWEVRGSDKKKSWARERDEESRRDGTWSDEANKLRKMEWVFKRRRDEERRIRGDGGPEHRRESERKLQKKERVFLG